MRGRPKHITSEVKVLGMLCDGEPLYLNVVTGAVCIGNSKNIVSKKTFVSLLKKGFIFVPMVYALTADGRSYYEGLGNTENDI